MSLSLGISHLALLALPAGTTRPSVSSSSFSSQTWQQSSSTSLSLRNSRSGSSRQVPRAEAVDRSFARKDLSAEYVADRGELSGEDFGDHSAVSYRVAAVPRAKPQRSNNGKFWRRFPGLPQGGSQDVTVPLESLKRGKIFRGTVSSVQPFGAFVWFGAFADGLIHISKLSTGYVKNVSDVVEVGQEVMVSIVNVEEATGRISLSIVEKDQIDVRKPYVSPRLEEARRTRERRRFQSGSGRSVLTIGEREERVSRGSSSYRSMESRVGGERPRYQPASGRISHSIPKEEQERFSRNPYASSWQRAARREGGERPRFQSRSGRRIPFGVEEEEKDSTNLFAPTRLEEAGEGDTGSRNPFASPRKGQSRIEDRQSRNPFASSRQGEAREERMSRNPSVTSRGREAGAEGSRPRFQHQGNDGNFQSIGRITRVGSGADRGEQMKPKMRLVQVRRDDNVEDKSVEDKVSSLMRSGMTSWYGCDCC